MHLLEPLADRVGKEAVLPPLLRYQSGRPVTSARGWQRRRKELLALAQQVYGEMPQIPGVTRATLLHEAVHRRLPGVRIQSWRVAVEGRCVCTVRILLPAGTGPCAAIVCGDACWAYATDAVQRAVLQQGHALVLFNRVDVMSDVAGDADSQSRCDALQGYTGASLAAWAWGYQWVIDALLMHPLIRADAIAVVGHSRGGKAALLAGALDRRIALTSANNSGAGGAGCWRQLGPGAESLEEITHSFPAWFSPSLAHYAGQVGALPFDQHMLKALVAPRWLLTTEALGDVWANPAGSLATHEAAQEVYQWLGVPERIAITLRRGGHAHTPADWATLLKGLRQMLDHA